MTRARERPAPRLLLALATLLVGFYVADTLTHVVPGGQWLEVGVYHAGLALCAAACLLRGLRGGRELRGWVFLGLALAAWAVGDLYWQLVLYNRDPVPVPSLADAGYLAVYPLAYAGVLLLLRGRMAERSAGRWLDGVIGGLAVASVAAAIVVQAVDDTLGGDTLANVTNLAYPLGDGLLLALIVASLALTGWRPGRMWLLTAAGLAVFAASDSAYLYLVATDTYHGGVVDCGWPVGMLLIAWAAWQPAPGPARPTALEGWRVLVLPMAFGALALAMLVYDHSTRVSVPAVALAAASVVAVMGRMGMAMAENARLLARTREEALTDALTGLGNRRRLLADLEAALAHGRPSVLVLFDLNGFKTYNDSFGHPAGDALLHQLSRRLRAVAVPLGTAYRLGGDEFCLIADEAGAEVALARALEALTAEGEAFSIDASWGRVLLPAEASDPSGALGLADTRMYARKQAGRPSPGRQSTDVLLGVLQERHPDLSDHLRGVARLAHDVGARLGMTGVPLDDTGFAAELHDVGKVAIPESILDKPGPLDAAELAFMRRHTLVGERIVAAAPALARAARLVRASHEFWDGTGYPDGLAGEEIPLGARVVAACDAFEAITSDRPYRAARSVAEAVLELERCAGTQFDPRVVAALVACVDEREAAGLDVLEGLRAAAPWA